MRAFNLLDSIEWLTLNRAADVATEQIGKSVSANELLQIAQNGGIQLCINFIEPPYAKLCETVLESDITFNEVATLDGKGTIRLPQGAFRVNESTYLREDAGLVRLIGVWRLSLLAGGTLALKNMERKLLGFEENEDLNLDGCFVESLDGRLARLYSNSEDEKLSGTFPLGSFPAESIFVIRSIDLKTFIESASATKFVAEPVVSKVDRFGEINQLLKKFGNNKAAVARELSISRARVWQIINKHQASNPNAHELKAQDPFGWAPRPASDKGSKRKR